MSWCAAPGVKTPGYCRMSLRDMIRVAASSNHQRYLSKVSLKSSVGLPNGMMRQHELNLGYSMKRLAIFTLVLALLCGCQTQGHIDRGALSRVNLGMTKQEVITSLGTPESVSAERGTETLTY